MTEKNLDSLKLKNTVIDGGYCIGCGACASVSSSMTVALDKYGRFQASLVSNSYDSFEEISPLSVCPFSEKSIDEDKIGNELFRKDCQYNDKIGYYIDTYAGFVIEEDFQLRGSSGGFVTWISALLLQEGLVDAIIHVRENDADSDKLLFKYEISFSLEDIKAGAKSRYYPVEMSQVLQIVRDNPIRYALVGIPCFIKAIRLLMRQDPVIASRIKFCIGLVCGHLKTTAFAESLAWLNGIEPDNILQIDFRKKNPESYANDYAVEITGIKNDQTVTIVQPMRNCSYLADWGVGLFKYKACDFCDDVVAETADISFGDAWLPQYIKKGNGTNIIIVRNPTLHKLIEKFNNNNQIYLEKIEVEKVVESQAGGFRHRREGLSYRLFLTEQDNVWHPPKRVTSKTENITEVEKQRFSMRYLIAEKSHLAFKIAKDNNNYSLFDAELLPIISAYYKTYPQKKGRAINFLRLMLKKITSFIMGYY
ncbi:MAG: coenzyme F420 hydrogenase [Dolichospermum sp. LBC05a]|jgi:coenzyme F420-reducing hydrogenase beta subunit|nr:Coenzyme F420 hydrogenase/dehydrogenase, beta subunit C-terminal domain [Dolichospermum sp. OL01]MCO5796412.1 Coenzyme F420 hydrogenase/dehydrogenase, beta subunit C-terminal domain [Dolichospermum sp. OL03]MCS6281620.1 Coenzyme F420 hydrogenase/dehydrogenase, beta subunit C-terminal domain [Dolichospermum sp.]QSV58021.1 MAG: coenzyme F420 hydrogenase [Dolichospermum sp. LBC05a]